MLLFTAKMEQHSLNLGVQLIILFNIWLQCKNAELVRELAFLPHNSMYTINGKSINYREVLKKVHLEVKSHGVPN